LAPLEIGPTFLRLRPTRAWRRIDDGDQPLLANTRRERKAGPRWRRKNHRKRLPCWLLN